MKLHLVFRCQIALCFLGKILQPSEAVSIVAYVIAVIFEVLHYKEFSIKASEEE